MDILQMCLLLLGLLAWPGPLSCRLPVPAPFVQIGLGSLASWPVATGSPPAVERAEEDNDQDGVHVYSLVTELRRAALKARAMNSTGPIGDPPAGPAGAVPARRR